MEKQKKLETKKAEVKIVISEAKLNQAEKDTVAESEESIKVELKPERIIDKDKVYEEGI